MNGIYLGIFSDAESVRTNFSHYDWNTHRKKTEELDFDGVEILLAYYSYEDYSGQAYVLFRKDGKLYEVVGSHCSCYGLEGQWDPEETDVQSIRHRLEQGSLGRGYAWRGEEAPSTFADELKQVLDDLEEEKKGYINYLQRGYYEHH